MKILLYLFVVAAFIAMGEGLMCWSCDSSNPFCRDFDVTRSNPGVVPNPCPKGLACCYKKTWKLNNGTYVTERDCTTKLSYLDENQHTVYCGHHFCNGVSSTGVALTALMVLIAPLIYRN